MASRQGDVKRLYEGLAFVSRQSRELGALLHPELPLVAHSLLMFVDSEPGSRAVDIAAAYGLEKSTVSRQLSRLDAAGLIRCTGERPGRRGRVLELTDEGKDLLARSVRSAQVALADHLRDWSDEDLAQLGNLLARFVQTSRKARLRDIHSAAS